MTRTWHRHFGILRQFWGIGLAILLIGHTTAHAQTLDEAMQILLDRDLSMQAANQDILIQEQSVRLAKSDRRPRITLEGTGLIGESGLFLTPENGGRQSNFSSQLVATQTLYQGGRIKANILRAEDGVMTAKARLARTRQAALLNGVRAYMNVMSQRSILEIRQKNMDVLFAQTEATQLRFDLGKVSRTDLNQAEASLLRARSNIVRARTQLANAETRFSELFFMTPSDLVRPDDFTILPDTLAQARQQAADNNPALQEALFQIDALEHAVTIARAARKPRLSANVAYRSNRANNDRFLGQTRDDVFVSGNVTIPISTGGSLKSSIKSSKADLAKAKLVYQLARREVDQRVTSTWIALDNARLETDLRAQQLDRSEAAYTGAVEEQKLGRRSTFEVLTLEQELLQSRISYLQSQIDITLQSASILEAVGTLDKAFKA